MKGDGTAVSGQLDCCISINIFLFLLSLSCPSLLVFVSLVLVYTFFLQLSQHAEISFSVNALHSPFKYILSIRLLTVARSCLYGSDYSRLLSALARSHIIVRYFKKSSWFHKQSWSFGKVYYPLLTRP